MRASRAQRKAIHAGLERATGHDDRHRGAIVAIGVDVGGNALTSRDRAHRFGERRAAQHRSLDIERPVRLLPPVTPVTQPEWPAIRDRPIRPPPA